MTLAPTCACSPTNFANSALTSRLKIKHYQTLQNTTARLTTDLNSANHAQSTRDDASRAELSSSLRLFTETQEAKIDEMKTLFSNALLKIQGVASGDLDALAQHPPTPGSRLTPDMQERILLFFGDIAHRLRAARLITRANPRLKKQAREVPPETRTSLFSLFGSPPLSILSPPSPAPFLYLN
jgi:hypothetical protein